MIKYDMEKIMRVSDGDPTSILTVIHILTYNRIPSSNKDPIYKYYGKSYLGNSFLANPKQLLVERKNYSNLEAANYVVVASYRNYHEYKRTGDTTLQLLHFPLFEEIINENRLLRIENGVIHFKFEDNAKQWSKNGN
tara:strand:+ start:2040 stop:2450 length:411 start_codon:yes stop_codon:yes gene_type:complete